MAERILPDWVKCNDCGKWRHDPLTEGELTTNAMETWTCRSYRKQKKVMEFSIAYRISKKHSMGYMAYNKVE